MKQAKPNYMQLLMKTSKEFCTVVKRTIQYEKLKPTGVYHIDAKNTHDVVIETDSRIVAIRAFKGKKNATVKEFNFSQWLEMGRDFEKLRSYLNERDELSAEWA